MASKVILLRGYYGYGNFGDDLLMISTYNYVKSIFPETEIKVFSFSPSPEYIQKLLPEAQVVTDHREQYQLIVHGGGGVYFDFNMGNLFYLIVNSVSKLIGAGNMSSLIKRYRKARNIPVEMTDYRIGIGIGVGRFTRSSKKLSRSLLAISDYDLIMLRDQVSMLNFQKLNTDTPTVIGTDLVFGQSLWKPKNWQGRNPDIIGFVLRNSPGDWYNERLIDVARSLKNRKVQFFLFDKNGDSKLATSLEHEFVVHIWDPSVISLEAYLLQLSGCALLVTSRAHGAIVGACLGTPSIIVEIEPKLKTIHQMLPGCTRLIRPEAMDDIPITIENMLADFSQNIEPLKQDLQRNSEKLEQSLEQVSQCIKQMMV